MINTSADPEGWAHALDEYLHDADTFADYIYGHCARTDNVSADVVRRLCGLLSVGRIPEARAFGVPELCVVLMTEQCDLAMAARSVLREKYLAAKSEYIAALKWQHEDGDAEAFAMGLDDERGDVGSEFDGVVVP